MSKKDKEQNNNKGNNNATRIILVIIAIILLIGIVGFAIYNSTSKNEEEDDPKKLAYTDLIRDITDGTVEKVEMTVGSTSVKVKLKDEEEEKTTIVPNTQAFIELVQDKIAEGNNLKLIQKSPNVLLSILEKLVDFLPTIILVALLIAVFKMEGLGDKGKVYDDEAKNTKVKFEDIAGMEEEKEEMLQIVQFLKEPEKFTKMGARVPKGILLYGKPGTGKTLIAKAIAGEANVPFISISGSEFIEMFAGLGASRVRRLFEKARKIAPCIIFIDEIDAIGSRRSNATGAESENNQTLNQLLVEMDGFDSEETIIVLAATNRPEMLDKALLRPGRFDRQITIQAPDLKGREAILKIHAKNKQLANDVDLHSIAEDTAGLTGADLENILNEAAIQAAVNKHKKIEVSDIEEAEKKVTVGLEKKSRVMSDKDKKLTAFHEAGHAVVSRYLPTQEPVKEISIVPRGIAGGYTMYRTDEDKNYISKTEMEERIVSLMGGRAGEKLALNDVSTGASNDFEVATEIAKNMVTKYGMSNRIGNISINTDADPYELQILGEKFGDAIGLEVKAILDKAYDRAVKILTEHRDKHTEVAMALIEKEKLNEEDFKKFFEE